MPASELDVFEAPEDLNTRIWRYMGFTKFVSMLENGGLFFSRADWLGDPFEGSLPKHSEIEFRASLKSWYNLPDEEIQRMMAADTHFYRKWMMVNCWHENQYESAAMWNLYAKSNEAIAICSTFAKLRDALDKECHVGIVQYIDYDQESFPRDNIFWPFVHKRLSFAHEMEIRALKHPAPWNELDAGTKWTNGRWRIADSTFQPPPGVWQKLSLEDLIEEIRVAPTSQQWFKDLVQQTLKRYSLDKPVKQSSLDEAPFY